MNKFYIFLLSLLQILGYMTQQETQQVQDMILTLTETSIEQAINSNDFLMVYYYVDWCDYCKEFDIQYYKLAQILKQDGYDNIKLAKINVNLDEGRMHEEIPFKKQYGITGYPTLQIFIYTESFECKVTESAEDIYIWIKQQLICPSIELDSIHSINQIIENNQVSVFYCGEPQTQQFKVYSAISRLFNSSVPFGSIFNQDLRQQFCGGVNPKVFVNNKFDDMIIEYTRNFSIDDLKEFIRINKNPSVYQLNEQTSDLIIQKSTQSIILMYSSGNSESVGLIQQFSEIAQEIKGKIMFVKAELNDTISSLYAQLLGIMNSQLPVIRLLISNGFEFQQYNLQGEITAKSILKFYEDFLKGRLKPYKKSEEIPETVEGPVQVVVGKNFKEIVQDNKNSVMVNFYSSDEMNYQQINQMYDNLAKYFQDIDMSKNEVEDFQIYNFPTFKFYSINNKSQPISFYEDDTEKELIKFIQDNLRQTTLIFNDLIISSSIKQEL